jgi:hypothetical protein
MQTSIPDRQEKTPMPSTILSEEQVLRDLRYAEGPRTQQQIGASRYRLKQMVEAKLLKRVGSVKVGSARKAVAFELTAKGRKRAEKL